MIGIIGSMLGRAIVFNCLGWSRMARNTYQARKSGWTVGVDDCRVRLQTGKPVLFVDVRKPEDWARSQFKIAGAVRLLPEQCPAKLLSHKNNYIVVYCA